jgi:two-component system phosphate regulon response regulator PhoB
MAKGHILVVEDERDILELLRYNLEKDGFTVDTAASGEAALMRVRSQRPDLILLDLMLPGLDGLDVCRAVRGDASTAGVPIIMLTAKSEDADMVAGLELGADDYITKPFSPRVLIARVKSVLRRRQTAIAPAMEQVVTGSLSIDPAKHEVLEGGRRVDLTATEFRILHFLASRPGWVFTRAQIVDAVRGDGYPVTDRAVDVQIVGLRRKLGSAAASIETVRGVGYRFGER